MGTITFSEYSLGTIDPAFVFADNGVQFDGIIVSDFAQPQTPAIAANNSYKGPVFFSFDKAVDSVDLDVGYFDNIGSTRIEFRDPTRNLLHSEINTVLSDFP